jgi:CubicO group peptidase (beta-lactamase class C family)
MTDAPPSRRPHGPETILPGGIAVCVRGAWGTRGAAEAGFDPAKLAAAVELAKQKTVAEPEDLGPVIVDHYSAREAGFRVLGPTGTRTGGSGLVVRGGYVVAQRGDVERPAMVFSVAESVLATVAGVAVADGRIAGIDDPVARYVPGPWFTGHHNGAFTWSHLLEQSSDGRVNLLALSLLHVLREPLPIVLRERIMDPIGASSTWRWHGYETCRVELDGLRAQPVSGGGHFGGGLFISTTDLARFGLLWWMNTDRRSIPAAPASAFWADGFGGNDVYVDREHDLVIVLRWVPDGGDDGGSSEGGLRAPRCRPPGLASNPSANG